MEYAILFKKIQLSENTYIFIPTHMVKGISVNGEFYDEIDKIYCDIEEMSYCNDNDDYYVGYIISYEELKEKYKNDSEEFLKLNYFNDFRNSIIVGYFDEKEDLIKKIINIKDVLTNNIDDVNSENYDNYYEEIIDINSSAVYLDLYTIKSLLLYDADNIKSILREIVEYIDPTEFKDNSQNSTLNLTHIYKILINKIENKDSLISDEKKYIINFNDIETINKLLDVEKSIFNLYGNLLKLELKDRCNSEEYNKNLDYLNIAIDVEKKIYKKLNLSFEKALAILEYIINIPKESKESDYYVDEIDSIFSSEHSLYINRILHNLRNYILGKYDILEHNLNSKLRVLLINLLGNDIYQYNDSEIINFFEINKFFENQILIELLNRINTSNNIIFSRLKYVTAFLNSDYEYNMIFKRDNFCSHNLEVYGYNKDIIDKNKNIYCENTIMREIFKLLNISEEQYNNKFIKSLVELIQTKIDIVINMLDDSKKEEIKEKIKIYITNNIDEGQTDIKKLINKIFGKSNQIKKY